MSESNTNSSQKSITSKISNVRTTIVDLVSASTESVVEVIYISSDDEDDNAEVANANNIWNLDNGNQNEDEPLNPTAEIDITSEIPSGESAKQLSNVQPVSDQNVVVIDASSSEVDVNPVALSHPTPFSQIVAEVVADRFMTWCL